MSDPVSNLVTAALREVFVDIEVERLMVLILLVVLGHVGVVLLFLIVVSFCGR